MSSRLRAVGMDVIFVHRRLKNPVEVPEYVLLSEDLYRSGGTSLPDHPTHEISHGLEKFGPVCKPRRGHHCGMKYLTREAAFGKLVSLVQEARALSRAGLRRSPRPR